MNRLAFPDEAEFMPGGCDVRGTLSIDWSRCARRIQYQQATCPNGSVEKRAKFFKTGRAA